MTSIIDRDEHHSIKGTFCDGEASENNRRRLPQRARIQSALPTPWNIFVTSLDQKYHKLTDNSTWNLPTSLEWCKKWEEDLPVKRRQSGNIWDSSQHMEAIKSIGEDLERSIFSLRLSFSFLRLKYRVDCKPVQCDGFQQLPDTFFISCWKWYYNNILHHIHILTKGIFTSLKFLSI